MRSTWSEPYLWLHLAGLAAVPILLELCLVGLKAVDSPLALVWVALVGIGPIAWMQWNRPFSIFSLLPLVLQPNHLTETQRRILGQFKSPVGRVVTVVIAVLALVLLWKLQQWLPYVRNIAVPGGKLGGLGLATVAFLLSNLFLQVPASVVPVLLTGERQLGEPYRVSQIPRDFTLIGLGVKQILPVGAAPDAPTAPASPPVAPASTPVATPVPAPGNLAEADLEKQSAAPADPLAFPELIQAELVEPSSPPPDQPPPERIQAELITGQPIPAEPTAAEPPQPESPPVNSHEVPAISLDRDSPDPAELGQAEQVKAEQVEVTGNATEQIEAEQIAVGQVEAEQVAAMAATAVEAALVDSDLVELASPETTAYSPEPVAAVPIQSDFVAASEAQLQQENPDQLVDQLVDQVDWVPDEAELLASELTEADLTDPEFGASGAEGAIPTVLVFQPAESDQPTAAPSNGPEPVIFNTPNLNSAVIGQGIVAPNVRDTVVTIILPLPNPFDEPAVHLNQIEVFEESSSTAPHVCNTVVRVG